MKVKMSGDSFVYIVIIIVIAVFVLNLKNIYGFFDDLKNGNLFKKPEVATKADDVQNKKPVEEYTIVTPSGDLLDTCKLIEEVNTTDTKTVKIDIYGNNEFVSSIKQTIAYSGVSEDLANYLYSESKKFSDLKTKNISLKGFSVEYQLSGTTALDTSVVIDLEKASIDSIVSDNNSILYLNGKLNMKVSDLVKEYKEGGFVCGE